MTARTWLNTDRQLEPGAELYRSERRFSLWAYTVSHGQLLLRSPQGTDPLRDTTIDVLFKPVTAMKVPGQFSGLAIRCATEEETSLAEQDVPAGIGRDERVLVLEGDGTLGYVICMGVGWHEGVLEPTQPSFFADHAPDAPAWARTPLFGVDAGLAGNVATPEELITALTSEESAPEERAKHRYVYVVMIRLNTGTGAPHVGAAGAFLTRDEAQTACDRLQAKADACWIEATPLAV